ncbi:DUF6286 domain-containing Asp23/Gls24 family envelope stress response protein [Kribbella sindirgiensis]|uniref:Asp23/Gls24 family envelope stress response protein n=1 Tax=Kribbella sindirgiensis TaxID=1124744 RepID=A0A4R0ITW9_9ACTN|nr:DUF6286 domain-containing Asp23/Gls24 family envelope stress response protein [Kribbella sindirgiensis]TCC32155.1 Asp23/Gls24 family envelope stress response protein [Kribbella sindirgiensis]
MVVADDGGAGVPTAAPAVSTPAPGPSSVVHGGDRGRLEIAQRAVERIAEITARNHGAVVRRDAVLGRGLPKARAVIAGQRVRIEVQVAAAFGVPLNEVAAEVRRNVAADVERFTGLGVDRVDVDLSAVESLDRSPGQAVDTPPSAAKAPAAAPAVAYVGVVVALALIGLGAVGTAEMLRSVGLLDGEVIPGSWFGRSVVLRPESWMRPVGIATVAIGLMLLALAVKPRRRTHLAVQGPDTIVWLRTADTARLAADGAGRVDSVTATSVVAKRKRLRARVTTFGDPDRVTDDVSAAIDGRLAGIDPRPRVRIDLRED